LLVELLIGKCCDGNYETVTMFCFINNFLMLIDAGYFSLKTGFHRQIVSAEL